MNARLAITLILTCAVAASAVARVYAKQMSRDSFVALQESGRVRDAALVTRAQLQLELSAITGQDEIALRAREQLRMVAPQGSARVLVRP